MGWPENWASVTCPPPVNEGTESGGTGRPETGALTSGWFAEYTTLGIEYTHPMIAPAAATDAMMRIRVRECRGVLEACMAISSLDVC